MKTEEELCDFLGKDFNKIEKLCRICLSENLCNAVLLSENSENRFLACVESLEEKLNMDEELSLWEKIAVFGRVNVNHEDDLLKYICEQCYYDVDVAYTFRVKCRKAEMLMQNALETLGRKPYYPGIVQIKKEELHIEFVAQEEDKLLDCTTENADQENIVTDFKNDAENEYNCKSETETDEVSNKIRNANVTETLSSRRNELKKENSFTCKNCKECFNDQESFKVHVKLHKEIHKCDICSKCYGTKKRLETHVRTHSGALPFSCNHCDEKFNSISILYVHKRKHLIKKVPKCKECNEIFDSKEELYKHKTEQHKKLFPCDVCNKIFPNLTNLKYHYNRAHAVEKPFLCDFCSKGFVTRPELDAHIRTHTGERPFVCDVCNKRFGDMRCLRAHKKSTGCLVKNVERRHECEVCNKKFVTSTSLTGHMRVHTGERPFECSVCCKRFGQKYKLMVHMRTHTGEKPFKCNMCSKSFTIKGNLMVHIKTHKLKTE